MQFTSEDTCGPITIMQLPLMDYRRLTRTTYISDLIMGQSLSRAERFWQACAYGHYVLVKRLLEEGDIDVNCISSVHGCSPIHVAAQGSPQVVELLIDAGCDVNATDANGNVALHHAAMSGDHEVMRILLGNGSSSKVNVNLQNRYGWTPLTNACYYGQSQCVRLLLDSAADVHLRNKDGRTVLLELCRSRCTQCRSTAPATSPTFCATDDVLVQAEAVSNGNVSQCLIDSRKRARLEVEADVGRKRSKHADDNQTMDKEMELARIAEMLLNAGANVNERASTCTRSGELHDLDADFTPLMFACYHSHYALAKVLLEKGSDVNACDESGWTALHWATERDCRDIVCLLLSYKCDPRLKDRREQMALDRARSPQLRALLHSASQCSNGYVTTDDELDDEDAADDAVSDCNVREFSGVNSQSLSTPHSDSLERSSTLDASRSPNLESPTDVIQIETTGSDESMQWDCADGRV